jgi:putative methyltransferase
MMIPRYVRVNTLQITTEKVIDMLKMKDLSVFVDAHVPDVLVLPPTSDTRAALQDLVTSHHVILQDKSSCFSALCLVHGFETRLVQIGYIDACAAPGNKTSHLASLTSEDKSTIDALDKSPDRYKMLRRRMKELAGEKAVQCHNLDFFDSSSIGKDQEGHHFSNIQAIMLDPSCSGSGMTDNHQEVTRDPKFVNDRVQSLSDFQLQALKHATSADMFPKVQRVVYSTCSLYIQENEGVVDRFLQEHGNDWVLVAPKCLASWERRGLLVEGLTSEQAHALIRVHPDDDASNGFFVACFEKVDQSKHTKRQLNDWKGVSSVAGISIYQNNFAEARELDIETRRPPKRKMTEPIRRTQELEGTKSEKIQKVEKNTMPVVIPNHAKKIAKKMEWKRKQRERKEARLLSNPKKE